MQHRHVLVWRNQVDVIGLDFKIVSVSWNRKVETDFLAGIKIVGEDRLGKM